MVIQDLRYALRQLRTAPGFAFTVALTLALSVGVATAVFCVIDTVILRPLPFAHPERIVSIESISHSGYTQPASWPSYRDERAQTRTFAALAGYNNFFRATVETPTSGPVLLDTVHSSDNFFQVFGVQPLLGRTYLPGEEQDGKNQLAVLSYDVWQTYFGGDRSVLNRPVKMDGVAYTIIGVMPAGFRYPVSMRNVIYTPRLIDKPWMQNRGSHWMRTVARIKDGVTFEQAQADLQHVFADIGRAYPDTDGGRTVHLQLLAQSVVGQSRGPLWTLLGAVLAVLAIGCVNIAGLLLARGVKREREMAMRTAIGAGRARLIRQVLTEGVLLALMGAAGAVVLATSMLDVMRLFLIKALARGADIHMNWMVLGVGIALAVAVSLASSLYPALRLSGLDPNRALKSGGNSGADRSQHHLRSAFVITQVALTLLLLVVSGLLIRVVTRYRHVDLGFDPNHILTTSINLTPSRYAGRDAIADFYQPLVGRLMQIPGVRAVGVISLLPIENWGSNSEIHIAGQPPNPPNEITLSEVRYVSAGYFDVFGIPLRRGRLLSPALDRPEGAPSAVVNEAFVKKFIPAGLDPTMQRIDSDPDPKNHTRIAGVVGNVRQNIYEPPLPEHDYLIDALPVKDHTDMLNGMSLVLRFEGDGAAIVPALRSAIHEVDPTVPFKNATTMSEVVSETLVFERMESWLFGVFASLALLLALVGLHGLVSHEVEQSTRDIGVRMALGASRQGILMMVMRRVAWMLAAGTAAGLVLILLARKLIGIVIYFEARREAGGLLVIALLLVAVGMLAALLPASRAASIEPMQALRTE
ncbi:MAG TPA: ABC transporter permease [Terracidiphilus sp.]|jgi:predicted permease